MLEQASLVKGAPGVYNIYKRKADWSAIITSFYFL